MTLHPLLKQSETWVVQILKAENIKCEAWMFWSRGNRTPWIYKLRADFTSTVWSITFNLGSFKHQVYSEQSWRRGELVLWYWFDNQKTPSSVCDEQGSTFMTSNTPWQLAICYNFYLVTLLKTNIYNFVAWQNDMDVPSSCMPIIPTMRISKRMREAE